MTMLFCNIGWMENYQGLQGTGDSIRGGGKFVEQSGHGHEVCNFLPCGNSVYGHVESIRGAVDTQIQLERLGAKPGVEFVSDIDVIWTATSPEEKGRRVVGWYRNATIYRKRQAHKKPPTKQHQKDDLTTYRIKAKASEAVLLMPHERDLILPKGKGWMGEKPWWYADSGQKDVASFLELVRDLMEGGPVLQIPPEEIQQPFAIEGGKKSIVVNVYERDPTARKTCISHWGAKCVVCGFDFEQTYGRIGEGFIHVHHLTPLSALKKSYKLNPIEHLRPVCPNCHSMIHRNRNNPLTIEQLKAAMRRK